MYKIRESNADDKEALLQLYKAVAADGGGIARSFSEIDTAYIEYICSSSKKNGVQFVIDNPDNAGELIAEIHCYSPGIAIFAHVFTQLTIVVHPQYQGKGLGKLIFSHLLSYIENNRKDIFRIELFAIESNTHAIKLYQQLGFVIEGRFENRIKKENGFEADTPMAWFNKNFCH